MATTNKDMSDMMRGGREALNSYMYDAPAPDDEAAETVPDDEAAEGEGLVLVPPGQDDDPEMFTYKSNGDGTWVVYPPGMPCDPGEYRIQSDHAATAEEMASMQTMLDEATATAAPPAESAEAEMGIEE